MENENYTEENAQILVVAGTQPILQTGAPAVEEKPIDWKNMSGIEMILRL